MQNQIFFLMLLVLTSSLDNLIGKDYPEAWQTTEKEQVRMFDPSNSDPKAIELADKLMTAMGGKENWEKTRFIKYDWIVERKGEVVADYTHLWDKYTGRYRVEGKNREGKYILVLFNINTRDGIVFVDGSPVSEEDTEKYLEFAYGRFVNDSYWILMPYKLKDPGVTIRYAGFENDKKGNEWDIVHLTCEPGVGLTSEDQWWAYINRTTGLMDKWEYILQGEDPNKPRSVSTWVNWQKFGNIMLSTEKVMPERETRILFKNVAVPRTVPDIAFTSPDFKIENLR